MLRSEEKVSTEHKEDENRKTVKPNVFRELVDSILKVEQKDSIPLREAMLNNDDTSNQFLNYSMLKRGLILLTEKHPIVLIISMLSWLFFIVYSVLKLTFLN